MKISVALDIFTIAPALALWLLRIDNAWICRQMAERLGLKGEGSVSGAVMVCRWESGKVEISRRYREKIAAVAREVNWPLNQYTGLFLQFNQIADKIDDREVTYTHSLKVAQYAEAIGRRMIRHLVRETLKQFPLDFGGMEPKVLRKKILAMLVKSAMFHDIGKVWISNRIIRKAGPLTESQKQKMRSHAILTDFIISSLLPMETGIAKVASMHHELLNGMGYPKGLTAGQIPRVNPFFS